MPTDPSYDWLYEDGAKTTATSTEQLPPPRLPEPGGKPPRPPRGIRRALRWPMLFVIAWVVFLAAVPLWAWSTVARTDAEPAGNRPGDQPGTTYLIVGSDSRRGLSAEQRKELVTGGDVGARTDTIMLMHVGAGPTLLLSIPRDSFVDIPGYGRTKINAAYAYGGAPLLVQTLEEETGVRIDNYVEIGLGGLVNVVDAVGGIEICPPQDINDELLFLEIKKGCQWVDGPTALSYSRSRHAYTTQDIQRVQAQREVIGSIAREVRSPWTVLNPLRYWNTITGGAESVQIGQNVGFVAMARFATALANAMSGNGLSCTVPVADFAVTWDRERALAMFGHIKNDTTDQIGDLCTQDGLPKD